VQRQDNARIHIAMSTLPALRQVAPYPPQTQRFVNGEIHDWYRLILGYPDHLVGRLLDEFCIVPGDRILDPFCGAGTTLVEAMKRGVSATGIEANPSSHFAATVKTNWGLQAETLMKCADTVAMNDVLCRCHVFNEISSAAAMTICLDSRELDFPINVHDSHAAVFSAASFLTASRNAAANFSA
jgi:hypothetical protein